MRILKTNLNMQYYRRFLSIEQHQQHNNVFICFGALGRGDGWGLPRAAPTINQSNMTAPN
jgi:hypothetical protein